MSMLTYDQLHNAVAGSAAGIRCRTDLAPLGGPGDKVFPPTYVVERNAETQYATEVRRVGGQEFLAVVLDSVASQANRLELALLDAYRAGALGLPVLSVDFRDTEARDLGRISALEASHRVFDALFRDSLLDGVLFRESPVGKAITDATPRNAAALYHHAPTTLLFGGWDSTGPRGGRGAKYERAITSEIVGLGVTLGVKTASRLDPAGIELKAGDLYEASDSSQGAWTLDEGEAALEKGKPKKYGKGKQLGRPSQANFGNVPPTIDSKAGGVTVDHIVATAVLSFIQLRRLRFPLDHIGVPLSEADLGAAEVAARATLAALGLAAAVLAFGEGFDLRSRCVLVPEAPPGFELVGRAGETSSFDLDRESALALLDEGRQRAAGLGLTWAEEERLLQPRPQLVELIKRSHALAAREEPDENEHD